MYFLDITEGCLTILGILYFFRELLKIVCILIPIGLIVMLMLDFAKKVISFQDDSKKTLGIVLRRILYTVAIFLIPSVTFSLLDTIGINVSDGNSCWAYVNNTSVSEVRNKLNELKENIKFEQDNLNNKLIEKKEATKPIKNIVSGGSSSSVSDNVSGGSITLDWNDLSKISNISSSTTLAKALRDAGNLKVFAPYAAHLLECEKKYKVNVFFLIGLEAHESRIISSQLSKDCNNLGGVKASPRCPGHDEYKKFSSKKSFITYHANLLGKKYLNKNGPHYHGKALEDIVGTYCGPSCPDWINDTKFFGNKIYKAVKKI